MGEAVVKRGPGEWIIPDRALAAARAAASPTRPVTASEHPAGDLPELLRVPGPVLLLDGDAARGAWDALEPDIVCGTGSAFALALVLRTVRHNGDPAGKLVAIDCRGGGLSPESILAWDLSPLRLCVLADPGTELSEAAAAQCRVVSLAHDPVPGP